LTHGVFIRIVTNFYLPAILLPSQHCTHVAFVNCLLKKHDGDDDDDDMMMMNCLDTITSELSAPAVARWQHCMLKAVGGKQ